MNSLTNIEFAQLVLLGVGVLSLTAALITHLIVTKPAKSSFDPNKDTSGTVSTSRFALEPVSPTYSVQQPYLRVKDAIQAVRPGDLKKTAKMHLGKALRSSQRLLSAVRREIIPETPPSQKNNLGTV